MEYIHIVKDFALRTQKNLDYINEQQSEGREAYEITQLINSMLGLLIFPQQNYFNAIPKKPLELLKNEGWPIPQVDGYFEQVKDLNQLVRYLRNAVAHFNIEFIADGKGEIVALKVWNYNPKEQRIDWQARLYINDLRQFTKRFVDLIQEYN